MALPLTAHDIRFWSRIMQDHALFLHLGLEDATLKKDAWLIYEDWRDFNATAPVELLAEELAVTADLAADDLDRALRAYDARRQVIDEDLTLLLDNLSGFKETVLQRLKERKWSGWLGVSFVEHILEELGYFRDLLGRRVTAQQEAALLIDWIADHFGSAEGFLDPTEGYWKNRALEIRDTAMDYLEEYTVGADTASAVINEALNMQDDADDALREIAEQKPLSVIHPLMLDHWRREGKYMQERLERVQQTAGRRVRDELMAGVATVAAAEEAPRLLHRWENSRPLEEVEVAELVEVQPRTVDVTRQVELIEE